MSKFKKMVKEDLEKSLNIDKMSFDTEQLEPNPQKKVVNKRLILVPIFSLALIAVIGGISIPLLMNNTMKSGSKESDMSYEGPGENIPQHDGDGEPGSSYSGEPEAKINIINLYTFEASDYVKEVKLIDSKDAYFVNEQYVTNETKNDYNTFINALNSHDFTNTTYLLSVFRFSSSEKGIYLTNINIGESLEFYYQIDSPLSGASSADERFYFSIAELAVNDINGVDINNYKYIINNLNGGSSSVYYK